MKTTIDFAWHWSTDKKATTGQKVDIDDRLCSSALWCLEIHLSNDLSQSTVKSINGAKVLRRSGQRAVGQRFYRGYRCSSPRTERKRCSRERKRDVSGHDRQSFVFAFSAKSRDMGPGKSSAINSSE